MLRDKPQATAWLAEVAEALSMEGRLRCCPTVEIAEGSVTLTLVVPVQDLTGLELYERLRRVQDVAQLRALAVRYGIPPEQLEPYITRTEDA